MNDEIISVKNNLNNELIEIKNNINNLNNNNKSSEETNSNLNNFNNILNQIKNNIEEIKNENQIKLENLEKIIVNTQKNNKIKKIKNFNDNFCKELRDFLKYKLENDNYIIILIIFVVI